MVPGCRLVSRPGTTMVRQRRALGTEADTATLHAEGKLATDGCLRCWRWVKQTGAAHLLCKSKP